MAKKRAREADGEPAAQAGPAVDKMDEDESSDDEDFDVVNVDFEWFNFDPEVDFHGVKTLLRQLFDVDAALLDTSALTDLILAQHTIGSTVKVDGKATDAYAFLTVLNLPELRGEKPVADLVRYLADKARATESLAPVAELLASDRRVGLVLGERLINMPPEIAPPMYSMLLDEVEAAVEDGEPYGFSHYLLVSKTYSEVESKLEAGEQRRKRAREAAAAPLFYFHPEDEVLARHAGASGGFAYTREDEAVADSKRAFQEMGVRSRGSMMMIETGKLQGAVRAIRDYLGSPA